MGGVNRDRNAIGSHREGALRGPIFERAIKCLVKDENQLTPRTIGIRRHQHRPRDVVGGGVRGVGARAGAEGVDRRNPVVARGLRAEPGVGIRRVRAAGVRDQIGPGGVAVGRPLDAVAGDVRIAGVRRPGPAEVDLRAAHGRGRQARRRAGDAGDFGIVLNLHVLEGGGIVPGRVLDRFLVVARGRVGVADGDGLALLDEGSSKE